MSSTNSEEQPCSSSQVEKKTIQQKARNVSKKKNTKIWYKLKQKEKKGEHEPIPPLLRQPDDILWTIFQNLFEDVRLVDIKITQRGSVQRRYSILSILLVSKQIRELAIKAMFRYAIFEIPHFKLHKQHRRENKMKTLRHIQNLVLLWTPPPSSSFTTKRGDDVYVLQNIDHLRSLEVWLLASEKLRIQGIENPNLASRVEVHNAMLAKFQPSIASFPGWLTRLLRDAPKKYEGIKISLVEFFVFGTMMRVTELKAACISWPSKKITRTETIQWEDWARARSGLTCKKIYRRIDQGQHLYGYEAAEVFSRPEIAPRTGRRTFGRKRW